MQDYWNDPPDEQEPPEWYMTLEDVLEQQNPPQTVADAIRKALEEWVQEYNAQHDIEPPPTNEEPIVFEEPENAECPHGNGDFSEHNARMRRRRCKCCGKPVKHEGGLPICSNCYA
jgi:hypothetical protein